MDNYYNYAPHNTKTIKSKPVLDLELDAFDDKTTKVPVGTRHFKVLNDVEYKGNYRI